MQKSLLLKTKDVCNQTSLSRTTIWRMVRSGDFPRPIKISNSRVAFDARDVEQWASSLKGAANV